MKDYYFFDEAFSNYLDGYTQSIYNSIKLADNEVLHKVSEYTTIEKLWMKQFNLDIRDYLSSSSLNSKSKIYYIDEDHKGNNTFKCQVLRYGYTDFSNNRHLMFSMFYNSDCTVWDLVIIQTLEYVNMFLHENLNISAEDFIQTPNNTFSDKINTINFYIRIISFIDNFLNLSYNDYKDFYKNFTARISDLYNINWSEIHNIIPDNFEDIYEYAITKGTNEQDYEELVTRV